MDRKAIARETLEILDRGYYDIGGKRVEIAARHRASVENSRFFDAGERPALPPKAPGVRTAVTLRDCSTVEAILTLAAEGREGVAVLNFASAKNPGGGFLNGAMAQEESLAASGGLYPTLTKNQRCYDRNRACKSMVYTDCAIWSPDVVFFRDGAFRLIEEPAAASVLTLPAVNLGQVMQRGEDIPAAKAAMARRMERALALFGAMGSRTLILGAYGCGVFRNDPEEIACRWQQLLASPDFRDRFEEVVFAVLDRSRSQSCRRAFATRFGGSAEKGEGDGAE